MVASRSAAAGEGSMATTATIARRHHRNHWTVLYGWFFFAYFAQGVFQAYAVFEQPYLASFGVGLEDVGFVQALGQLPWVFKIIFSLPSDAYDCGGLGFRRPYALGGLLIGAAFLAVLAIFQWPAGGSASGALSAYALIAIARNTGVCMSDVATDGLAVDCDRASESGIINAVMTAGRMLGLVVGSSAGGAVADALGYPAMVLVLSALVLAVSWLPLLLREERQVTRTAPAASAVVAHGNAGTSNPIPAPTSSTSFSWEAFSRFREPTVLLFLVSAAASNAGLAVANFPLAAWQRTDFGFSLTDVGMGATVASVGLLVGSLACGPLFDRVSKRGALLVAGTASTATLLSFLLVSSRAGVFAARFFAGTAEGALWIVQAGLTMRLADRRAGASFFALAIMVMNFAIMLGQAISGALAQNVGLRACFLVGGLLSALQLLPLPWLTLIDKEEADGTVAVLHNRKVAVAAPAAASPGMPSQVAGTSFVHLQEFDDEAASTDASPHPSPRVPSTPVQEPPGIVLLPHLA